MVNKNLTLSIESQTSEVIDEFKALHATEEIAQDKLTEVVTQVLSANPDVVKKYQAGKTQVIGFLMGQVAQEFEEKLDMKLVRTELQRQLS